MFLAGYKCGCKYLLPVGAWSPRLQALNNVMVPGFGDYKYLQGGSGLPCLHSYYSRITFCSAFPFFTLPALLPSHPFFHPCLSSLPSALVFPSSSSIPCDSAANGLGCFRYLKGLWLQVHFQGFVTWTRWLHVLVAWCTYRVSVPGFAGHVYLPGVCSWTLWGNILPVCVVLYVFLCSFVCCM